MKTPSKQKLRLLYIIDILSKKSDEEHPISATQIMEYLRDEYGIKCERKTISRDIDCLIKFGYNIKKNIGGGCYLENAEFSVDDVDNLLKGINKLDNLDPNEKMVLKTKVKKLINVNKR
jgi:hypothetical protein